MGKKYSAFLIKPIKISFFHEGKMHDTLFKEDSECLIDVEKELIYIEHYIAPILKTEYVLVC